MTPDGTGVLLELTVTLSLTTPLGSANEWFIQTDTGTASLSDSKVFSVELMEPCTQVPITFASYANTLTQSFAGTCTDDDTGGTDLGSNSQNCAWYSSNNDQCGNHDVAGTLVAGTDCCACGGGTISYSQALTSGITPTFANTAANNQFPTLCGLTYYFDDDNYSGASAD